MPKYNDFELDIQKENNDGISSYNGSSDAPIVSCRIICRYSEQPNCPGEM